MRQDIAALDARLAQARPAGDAKLAMGTVTPAAAAEEAH